MAENAYLELVHASLEIQAPVHFAHAGDLDPRSASNDPRKAGFADTNVDIDLRGCEFIQPAAVLWSVVYGLLAAQHGGDCRLLVPENLGVAIYLKTAGLFEILQKSGVQVDDQGVGSPSAPQLILPIARFASESKVDELANAAGERLSTAGLGAANIYSVVAEVFAELAMNAVQHSESEIGAFGLIQFYQSEGEDRFICAVADGGIGIRHSLESNPVLRKQAYQDWVAIDLALQEGTSRTGSNRRGIGLFGVADRDDEAWPAAYCSFRDRALANLRRHSPEGHPVASALSRNPRLRLDSDVNWQYAHDRNFPAPAAQNSGHSRVCIGCARGDRVSNQGGRGGDLGLQRDRRGYTLVRGRDPCNY